MTNLYSVRAFKAFVCLLCTISLALSLSAQCPAGSVPVSDNGNYGNGTVVCVSTAFSGHINLHTGAQLVIATGGNFTGNINAQSGAEIFVQADATFAPNNVNNFGGKITNFGNTTINFNLGGNSTIINSGEFTVNSGVNFNGAINITNTSCGSLKFNGNLTLNNNNSVFTNDGYVSLAGNFLLDQNNQFLNKGKLYVEGSASLKGAITNDGYMVFKNGGHSLQGLDSLINNNVMIFAGSTAIEKPIRNEGLFWTTGSATFQNSGNFAGTSTFGMLRIDGALVNEGRQIGGSGKAFIAGSTANNNGGTFTLAITSVAKDTTNFIAGLAKPAKPCSFGEGALPIVLQNFTAKLNGANAELHWSTVSELNGKYMIVQRSTDGVNFKDIKEVASTTNSTIVQHYSFVDYSVASGMNYYRLKLVSSDAPVSYSAILALKYNAGGSQATSVFPNPFKDYFIVKFATAKPDNAVVKMYNDKGTLVLVKKLDKAAVSFTIETPSTLPTGLYSIEINTNTEKYYHKLMKL